LATIAANPGDPSRDHHKSEIRNWLRTMEDVLPHAGRRQPRNGKTESSHTGLPLEIERMSPNPRLKKLLAAVYNQYQKLDDPAANKKCRQDFVFHMVDWQEDLQRLAELYQHPEKFNAESAGTIVAGFLYHAIPHLREAGRLMLDYDPEDVFGTAVAKKP
jgi:hypothetical protein